MRSVTAVLQVSGVPGVWIAGPHSSYVAGAEAAGGGARGVAAQEDRRTTRKDIAFLMVSSLYAFVRSCPRVRAAFWFAYEIS